MSPATACQLLVVRVSMTTKAVRTLLTVTTGKSRNNSFVLVHPLPSIHRLPPLLPFLALLSVPLPRPANPPARPPRVHPRGASTPSRVVCASRSDRKPKIDAKIIDPIISSRMVAQHRGPPPLPLHRRRRRRRSRSCFVDPDPRAMTHPCRRRRPRRPMRVAMWRQALCRYPRVHPPQRLEYRSRRRRRRLRRQR